MLFLNQTEPTIYFVAFSLFCNLIDRQNIKPNVVIPNYFEHESNESLCVSVISINQVYPSDHLMHYSVWTFQLQSQQIPSYLRSEGNFDIFFGNIYNNQNTKEKWLSQLIHLL